MSEKAPATGDARETSSSSTPSPIRLRLNQQNRASLEGMLRGHLRGAGWDTIGDEIFAFQPGAEGSAAALGVTKIVGGIMAGRKEHRGVGVMVAGITDEELGAEVPTIVFASGYANPYEITASVGPAVAATNSILEAVQSPIRLPDTPEVQ